MSDTNLTCSPGGTLEDLTLAFLSLDQEELEDGSEEDDGVDGAKKRKAPPIKDNLYQMRTPPPLSGST